MAVAVGDQRRRKEAMVQLATDIAQGEDNSIATAVRDSLERGWSFNFIDTLIEATKKKDTEIDRICARYYSEFLVSVNDMMHMKGPTSELYELVRLIHDDFGNAGDDLVKISTELDYLKEESVNARKVLGAVLHCKKIASMMVEARILIDKGKRQGQIKNTAINNHNKNRSNKLKNHDSDSEDDDEEEDSNYAAIKVIELIQIENSKINSISPMQDYVKKWLTKSVSELLGCVKLESDYCLKNARLNVYEIGDNVLVRHAKTCTAENKIIEPKVPMFGRRNSVFGIKVRDINDSNDLNDSTTISLKYVNKYNSLLNLDKFVARSQFEDLVPQRFIDTPSDENTQLLSSILGKLGPLHKAVHMHTVLGESEAFYNHIRSNRESSLIMLYEEAETIATDGGLSRSLPFYLSKITGFFSLECMLRFVINKKDVAFSSNDIKTLWDIACTHIDDLCKRHIKSLTTPQQVLRIKEEILLLCETVSDEFFSLRTYNLYETMRNLFERFESLQVKSVVLICQSLLQECSYQPSYISSEEIFITQIRAFQLDTLQHNASGQGIGRQEDIDRRENTTTASYNLDALEEDLDFSYTEKEKPIETLIDILPNTISTFQPETFAFSESVYKVLNEMYLLVTRFIIFAAKNVHIGSRGESLCEAIKQAFVAVFGAFSMELMKDGKEIPLSKVCQISIDATTLSLASDSLWTVIENVLSHFDWADSIDTHLPLVIVMTKESLNSVTVMAQDLMFEILSNKVDDLLDSLIFIDYVPQIVPRCPHEIIEEIVDFIQITFMCMTYLPQSTRDAAHFTCCTRVTNGIIQYILSPKVTHINVLCILNFDLDIKRLEKFADGTGVAQLSHCFLELKELVRSILHPDLEHFGDNPIIMRTLFPRLDALKLSSLLEKFYPTPNNQSTRDSSIVPHFDKTFIKNISKKLRSLNN